MVAAAALRASTASNSSKHSSNTPKSKFLILQVTAFVLLCSLDNFVFLSLPNTDIVILKHLSRN